MLSWDKLGGRVTQSLSPDDDDQEDFVVAFNLLFLFLFTLPSLMLVTSWEGAQSPSLDDDDDDDNVVVAVVLSMLLVVVSFVAV